MTLHTKGDGICISGGQYNTVILELKGAKLDEESVHSVGGTAVNILEAQGNYIELSGGDLVGNRGVSLTNARKNEIRLKYTSWRILGDYGIYIDGGAGNTIDAGIYLELLQGTGAKLNNTEGNYFVRNFSIRGGEVGIHISNSRNNYFEHYWVTRETAQNTLKEGIIISDGSKANVFKGVIVDGCGADGILISGPETEGNEIVAFRVSHCLGNGIRITDGAHHNKIIHGYYSKAFIEGNLENGILVENSDHNLIYGFHYNYYGKEIYSGRIADNMTGVRIIGSVGTVLKFIRIGYNRYAGMWLSGVASDKFPSAEVKALVKFEREDQLGGEVGVILDDGTRNVSLDVDISGFKAGLIMSGNARFNKVHADNIGDFSQIGIKMAEGANFNTLVIKWLGGSGMAILLEGVEHDSVKCYVDNVKGNGIVLRNSSHNTIKADVYRCSGDGFVLYGSSDNIFRNGQAMFNKGRGVVVKGGEGNSFLNFTVEQNSGGGMLIEGASKIRIKDSEVSWNELYGLWLKGARDVEIVGSVFEGGEARNTSGIIVEGGSKGISIGGSTGYADWKIGSNTIGGFREGILVQGPGTENIRISHSEIGQQKGNPRSWWELWSYSNVCGIVVRDGAKEVFIGGLADMRNYISNNDVGIEVLGSETEVKIQNCYIEQNIKGIVLGDGANHVEVNLCDILRNKGDGVTISGRSHHNVLSKCLITDNGGTGVVIEGGSNENILSGNEISDNSMDGVLVSGGSSRNTLRGNKITGNGGKGIRLSGGNNNIPPPVIDDFSVEDRRIQGYVEGVPRGSVVDVFADRGDEGERYIGSCRLVGKRFRLRKEIPEGMKLHAIVTDLDGNTSEFGTCKTGLAHRTRPPDIVFTSTREGDMEIYYMPSGGSVRRLTDHEADDHSGSLCPDSSKVLFVSDRSGNEDIWEVGVDGEGLRQVTRDGSDDYDPEWSPDGRKMVFVSERDGNPEIYVMDFSGKGVSGGEVYYDDGSAESEIRLEEGDCIGVHFSSEGGKLCKLKFYIFMFPAKFRWVVREWGGDEPGELIAEGETEPGEIGWHEVEVEVEVPPEFFVGACCISSDELWFGKDYDEPDKRSYIFRDGEWNLIDRYDCMIRAEFGTPSTVRFTEDGYMITRLTQDEHVDRYPSWSPDGREIVFSSDRGGDFGLYIMNSDGSGLRKLIDEPGDELKPCWSSDGKIAYVKDGDIYMILPDGSGMEKLTEHEGMEDDPAWSPDGKLLFSADWEGGWEIYWKVHGGRARRLTASLGDNTQPDAGR